MKVITVHGIRRQNRWYEQFEVLEDVKNNRIEVLKFDYGFFSIWDFMRSGKREEIIEKFCKFYSDKMINSTALPCAIAHSFGTYIVFRAMQRYSSIKFDTIIFCGSILNSKLDFRELIDKGQVKHLINDYGTKEWFIGATHFVIDKYCGRAGKLGFLDIPPTQKDNFINRKNYMGHSDYFLPIQMKANWVPHLKNSSSKFDFDENILRKEIIDRIYKNIERSTSDYQLNEARYFARIDNRGNYYAKYELLGNNDTQNRIIDHVKFTTTADGFHHANKMNFLAYELDSNRQLSYEIKEDNTHLKTFNISLLNPASYREAINIKFYFGWHNTMNQNGDTDHYVIKDVPNITISINFPNELKAPKIFEIKNHEIVGQKVLQKRTELDGSVTYYLKYANTSNNDGLILYYGGFMNHNSAKKNKFSDIKIGTGRNSNEFAISEVTSNDIPKVYVLEKDIELTDAASESVLEDRRNMFNEGFLVVKKKSNGQVIAYIESVIWNEKPFQTFDEISNFPMHYNVNGDTLYIIFIAVSKQFRRKGIATRLLKEIENVGRKYKVKKIKLVAKDNLVNFYSKFGFNPLAEMPAFLKGKPYRSILMEKSI